MVFGLHEYRPIYIFETSAIEAMRPILTRDFSFRFVALASSLCAHHGVEVVALENENSVHRSRTVQRYPLYTT